MSDLATVSLNPATAPEAILPGAGDVALLRRLLLGRAGLLRFPGTLEAEYCEHYARLTVELLRLASTKVVLAVLLIGVFTLSRIESALRPLWLSGYGIVLICITVVVAAAFIPLMSRRVHLWVGLAAFCSVLFMHIAAFMVSAEETMTRQLAEYGVIFVTMVAFTIAHIPFWRTCLWMMVAASGAIVLAFYVEKPIDWLHFFYYGIGSLAVGVVMGYAQEERERKVFLQEKLLALEKNELDTLSRELSRISRQDALTGLSNRRHFDEVLAREWAAAQREGLALNLLFIDVDFFKKYNDYYGHQAGDECLARVGQVLGNQAMRGADFVARYGGEEFVAMFPRTSREGLETIAQRIIEHVDALSIPHVASTATDLVSVSIGVASLVPARDYSAQILVELADAALYKAKQKGRHCYVTDW